MSESAGLVDLKMENGVAHLTLMQGARGNALSADLVEALIGAVSAVFDKLDNHTLILRGEGRHFCTGFDLGNLDDQSDGDLLQRFVRIEMLLAKIWSAPVRTIAFATGRTWGAGADLFTACDVRLATPQTRLRFPGAGFGLVLGTRRLAARVGDSAARRWTTSGIEIAAGAAQSAGLITGLVEEGCTIEERLHDEPSPAVDRTTLAALNKASRSDDCMQDLAHLVLSAAQPGLRDRIVRYAGRARG